MEWHYKIFLIGAVLIIVTKTIAKISGYYPENILGVYVISGFIAGHLLIIFAVIEQLSIWWF